MNNSRWLVFSFTLPAKSQAARVKVWRRLIALGAVQIKNTLYVLPAGENHQEQLTWLGKEAEEQGGEAIIISSPSFLGLSDAQIREAFVKARDADYAALESEIRETMEKHGGGEGELKSALRRFSRRLEAVRAVDFFPSGRDQAVAALLSGGAKDEPDDPNIPAKDPANYQGKTWVTRANPQVDRLASIWLIRRFIDGGAYFAFLSKPGERPRAPGDIHFDMAQAEFTHVGGMITFEVLCAAFGLNARIPGRMRSLLRAIDLGERDGAPSEAAGVKLMLDGLVRAHPGDQERADKALAFFDTLLAACTDEHARRTP